RAFKSSLDPAFRDVPQLQTAFDLSEEERVDVENDLARLIHREITQVPSEAREIIKRFADRLTARESHEGDRQEFGDTMRSLREHYHGDTDRLRASVAQHIDDIVRRHPGLRPLFTRSGLFQDPVVARILFERARLRG